MLQTRRLQLNVHGLASSQVNAGNPRLTVAYTRLIVWLWCLGMFSPKYTHYMTCQACCSLFWKCWMWIQPTSQLYTSAVTRLLQGCSAPVCVARLTEARAAPRLTRLTYLFNTGVLMSRGHCLVKDPAIIKAVSQVEGHLFSHPLVASIAACHVCEGSLLPSRICLQYAHPHVSVPVLNRYISILAHVWV